jgi:hypothetical protein
MTTSRKDTIRIQDFLDFGHIKGAVNIASEHFDERGADAVDQVLKHVSEATEYIVVHCMKSQVRGPRIAHVLHDALRKRGVTRPTVRLLHRGFFHFLASQRDRPDLFECA